MPKGLENPLTARTGRLILSVPVIYMLLVFGHFSHLSVRGFTVDRTWWDERRGWVGGGGAFKGRRSTLYPGPLWLRSAAAVPRMCWGFWVAAILEACLTGPLCVCQMASVIGQLCPLTFGHRVPIVCVGEQILQPVFSQSRATRGGAAGKCKWKKQPCVNHECTLYSNSEKNDISLLFPPLASLTSFLLLLPLWSPPPHPLPTVKLPQHPAHRAPLPWLRSVGGRPVLPRQPPKRPRAHHLPLWPPSAAALVAGRRRRHRAFAPRPGNNVLEPSAVQ